MKIFIGMLLIVYTNIAIAQTHRCVKWTWAGDVFNRKAICLQWEKR
jgi:hypothetical protein